MEDVKCPYTEEPCEDYQPTVDDVKFMLYDVFANLDKDYQAFAFSVYGITQEMVVEWGRKEGIENPHE
jgi:hypothetical protein